MSKKKQVSILSYFKKQNNEAMDSQSPQPEAMAESNKEPPTTMDPKDNGDSLASDKVNRGMLF